jgi:copper homeostasis protein
MLLEICANSVVSALAAQEGGAQRVELCTNLNEGGITPSYGEIVLARKLLHIKLYVLIRPRPGDFVYSDLEYEIIRTDIQQVIAAGCDGIVIGILKPDGSVDKVRCKPLVDMARAAGLGVTFHRAFDAATNQFAALEDIIEIGCERILTSGAQLTALEGARRIAELIKAATGRIVLMPGSGVNPDNLIELRQITGAVEFHTSAQVKVDTSMQKVYPAISFGDRPEITSAANVKQLIQQLTNHNI